VRQHVNPLSSFFQLPRQLPSPEVMFKDSKRPLHLDIGSARGGFLLDLAPLQPDWNHVGVEIRHPTVLSAERDRQQLKLDNLRFLFCNVNVSLEGWLAGLARDQLQKVSIQFPDPWFKRRHQKRRVLQPSLLLALAAALQPGRELFIQSDVLAVIEPMVMLIERSNCFERPRDAAQTWLNANPLPVPTERERYVLDQGLPAYRMLYQRNDHDLTDLKSLEVMWHEFNNPIEKNMSTADA
jgi:tRNA (guanine-N7-)-methyltransferase